MSSICKYCNQVELTFDKYHISKNGKMIPLDKQSGLPHQCSENPYNKGQTTTSTESAHNESSPATITTDILLQLKLLTQKVDKLLEVKAA